jgi:anti-sigma B factor antagonist
VNIEVVSEQHGEWTVIKVKGEVDVGSPPVTPIGVLRKALVDKREEGCFNQVVDFSQTTFLDSTGLGVIVGGLKRAREGGGELVLAISKQDNPRVYKVFEVTGLIKVFRMFDSVAEALAQVQAPAK